MGRFPPANASPLKDEMISEIEKITAILEQIIQSFLFISCTSLESRLLFNEYSIQE